MDLNDLHKIRKVDVPPFLLTRIQQKIDSTKRETWSRKVAFALNFGFALILCFNVWAMKHYSQEPTAVESYVRSTNLDNENYFYE